MYVPSCQAPPSGVGVFAELVRAGGPCRVDKAEERAISLRQLKSVNAHGARRCAAEGWIGKRFVDGEMRYEKLDPERLNLYDMASHVILPASHGHLLPDGKTKPSFVELLAAGSQRPEYFVSHYWAEKHREFIDCIAQHTRDRAYGGGKFVTSEYRGVPRGQEGADGDDGLLWVCAYANNQWVRAVLVEPDAKCECVCA